jgi:hypothetical protein
MIMISSFQPPFTGQGANDFVKALQQMLIKAERHGPFFYKHLIIFPGNYDQPLITTLFR